MKKIKQGKGSESEQIGFLGEVTPKQRQAWERERGRTEGSTPRDSHPAQDGATSLAEEYRGARPPTGLCWAERGADVPDLSEPGEDKQASQAPGRQESDRHSSLLSGGLAWLVGRVLRWQGEGWRKG